MELTGPATNVQDAKSAALAVATDTANRTNRKNGNSKACAKCCLALYDLSKLGQGGKLPETEEGGEKERENEDGEAGVPIVPRFYLLIALFRAEYFA